MSIKGFRLKNGTTEKYDYNELDNLPTLPSGTGLSDEAKQALLTLLGKVAYIDGNGQTYYDALEFALYPPANLVSISAVYTQSGTVYDTDSLDSLKPDLVVTASYDNSATAVVANYTLSGTLTAGTSTITVTYGGKTATFNVTVTHALQTFTVTNTLTNVTTSNNAENIAEGATYSATLTADSGYRIGSVTVSMGGTDITSGAYSSGVISVANVTGNIVIVASGAEAEYCQVQTPSSIWNIPCGIASANIYKVSVDVLIEDSTFGNNVLFFTQSPKWFGFTSGGAWRWDNADVTVDKTVASMVGSRATATAILNTSSKAVSIGWPNGSYSANLKLYGIKCYDANNNLMADLVPTATVGTWKDKVRGTSYTGNADDITVVEVV